MKSEEDIRLRLQTLEDQKFDAKRKGDSSLYTSLSFAILELESVLKG